MKTKYHQTLRAGFTLAEILLAMLVFAIAISTILALLARSIEMADEILLKDEAINLSSALDAYMTELPFIDAYNIIYDAQPDAGVLYAFQYRGDLTEAPRTSDSNLEPYALSDASILGQSYTITPAIREPGTGELATDNAEREGRLFRVELSQSPANPYFIQRGGSPTNLIPLPDNPNDASASVTGFPNYDSAVLVLFAEFYPVPIVGFEPDDDVEPVFSFNFAVRR
jgi:type II secretory pathway pseudopilin PulG